MKSFTSFVLFGGFALVSVATTSPAWAAPDGLALGIERAFGYQISSRTEEADGMSRTESSSGFTLGLSNGMGRVGVDYITRSGLSLGAGIGYGTSTVEVEDDGGGSGEIESSVFLIAPRIGSLMMFTADVGLWPRGGITYQSQTVDVPRLAGNTEVSASEWLLTLEAPLVIMPSSFGFSLAPTFDYVLSRSEEAGGAENEADLSGYQFGVTFGVFGVL